MSVEPDCALSLPSLSRMPAMLVMFSLGHGVVLVGWGIRGNEYLQNVQKSQAVPLVALPKPGEEDECRIGNLLTLSLEDSNISMYFVPVQSVGHRTLSPTQIPGNSQLE